MARRQRDEQSHTGSESLPPRVRAEGEGVLRYQGDGQQKGSLTSGAKLTRFLPYYEDLEAAHRDALSGYLYYGM